MPFLGRRRWVRLRYERTLPVSSQGSESTYPVGSPFQKVAEVTRTRCTLVEPYRGYSTSPKLPNSIDRGRSATRSQRSGDICAAPGAAH